MPLYYNHKTCSFCKVIVLVIYCLHSKLSQNQQLKATDIIFTVFQGQEFGNGLATWFRLSISDKMAVKMLGGVAVIQSLDQVWKIRFQDGSFPWWFEEASVPC